MEDLKINMDGWTSSIISRERLSLLVNLVGRHYHHQAYHVFLWTQALHISAEIYLASLGLSSCQLAIQAIMPSASFRK